MPILGTFGSNSARSLTARPGGAGGAGLYSFVDATFTPGGASGSNGPSLSQARSGISSTGDDSWKNDTSYFNTSNGIQLWTVPSTGTYRIQAIGASGGTGTRTQGYAVSMQGDFSLISGEVLQIVTGQVGQTQGNAGAGGGGTYVTRAPHNNNGSILIIAGGGGGSPGSCCGGQAPGGNASTGQGGTTAVQPGGVNIGPASAQGIGQGGGNITSSASGAGGGFFGGGTSSSAGGGSAYISGAVGGSGGGGFGGGGGAPSSQAGGGGGGYTGGSNANGGSQWGGGGGGGSYNAGTSQSNTNLGSSSVGSLTVTKIA